MTTKYLLVFSLIISALIIIVLFKKHHLFAKGKLVDPNINFYSIKINLLSGKPLDLKKFQNKVVLVVNVASNCGFTNQYEDLESLYQKYKSKDFVILGVPSNDFGGQEPGSAKDIQSFCQLNYGVSFLISEKVKINGVQQHELYDFLTKSNTKHKGKVRWNFTKFLVDKNGDVIDRFSPLTKPLAKKIVKRITQVIK
jgi:glutathione peroxidase